MTNTPTQATMDISDAAVTKATGEGWEHWFTLLDRAGAAKLDHKRIADVLQAKSDLSGWWTQMITVAYERARGLRVKHEKPDGFEISASKTLTAPVARVFAAWNNARERDSWLGKGVIVRKATADRSLRMTWCDGKTHVDVDLAKKGPTKSLVTVQHSKLESADEAKSKKEYWAWMLGRLAERLDKDSEVAPSAAGKTRAPARPKSSVKAPAKKKVGATKRKTVAAR